MVLGSEKGMKLLCIFSFFYYRHNPFYLGKVIYYKNYGRIGEMYVFSKKMIKYCFLLKKSGIGQSGQLYQRRSWDQCNCYSISVKPHPAKGKEIQTNCQEKAGDISALVKVNKMITKRRGANPSRSFNLEGSLFKLILFLLLSVGVWVIKQCPLAIKDQSKVLILKHFLCNIVYWLSALRKQSF